MNARTQRTPCLRNSCPIEQTIGVIGGVWKVIIHRTSSIL